MAAAVSNSAASGASDAVASDHSDDLPSDFVVPLIRLDACLDAAEAALRPFCAANLTAAASCMAPIDSARLNTALAFSSSALVYAHMRVGGADMHDHEVARDLAKARTLLARIAEADRAAGRLPSVAARPSHRIEIGAASRMVRAAISSDNFSGSAMKRPRAENSSKADGSVVAAAAAFAANGDGDGDSGVAANTAGTGGAAAGVERSHRRRRSSASSRVSASSSDTGSGSGSDTGSGSGSTSSSDGGDSDGVDVASAAVTAQAPRTTSSSTRSAHAGTGGGGTGPSGWRGASWRQRGRGRGGKPQVKSTPQPHLAHLTWRDDFKKLK